MNDEITLFKKAVRKYVRSIGSGLVEDKGYFSIGKVKYSWKIRKQKG